MPKQTLYMANGRVYRIVRPSTLDYYVWVEFQDSKGQQHMVMHYDATPVYNGKW